MGKVMERILRWIGFEVEEVEEAASVGTEPPQVSEAWVEDLPHGGKKRGTLVSLPGQREFQVILFEPSSFEEVQAIADQLKSRRPIILNIEHMESSAAQRLLNFLSGASYALNGDMQKVSNGIFFFAPPNVNITTAGTRSKPADHPSSSTRFDGADRPSSSTRFDGADRPSSSTRFDGADRLQPPVLPRDDDRTPWSR